MFLDFDIPTTLIVGFSESHNHHRGVGIAEKVLKNVDYGSQQGILRIQGYVLSSSPLLFVTQPNVQRTSSRFLNTQAMGEHVRLSAEREV